MLIKNDFTVPRSVDDVWAYLLDVEKVAPCMPGAELTETVDDRNWKGKLNMKFGPVAMSFAGTVALEERDDAAHRVKLHAKGMEQKGKGAANATVTSWMEPGDDGTHVFMEADITLTGAAAQLSRGLLPEVSKRLTAQFAECLRATLEANEGAPTTAQAPAPVGRRSPSAGSVWALPRCGRASWASSSACSAGTRAAKPRRDLRRRARRRDELAIRVHQADLRPRQQAAGGARDRRAPRCRRRRADRGGRARPRSRRGRAARRMCASSANPAYRDGQATSLAAALHEVAEDSEAAIVLQADQPGITRRRPPRPDRGLPRHAQADRAPAIPRRARDRRCSRARSMRRPATCRATPAPGC